MADLDVGLGHAIDAVFRPEQLHELHARRAREHVGGALAGAVDAGTMRDESAAETLEAGEAFGREDVDAEHHPTGRRAAGGNGPHGRHADGTAATARATGQSVGAQRTQGGEVKEVASVHGEAVTASSAFRRTV